MKLILNISIIILGIFISLKAYSQDKIEWGETYLLSISDFQSNTTKIGNEENQNYLIQPAINIDFGFHMSNYEFMLTKNFNSKVVSTFNRKASIIISPNQDKALILVNYAQLQFNLMELYARKLRKKIYESKGIFSETNFYQKLYDEIMLEYSERQIKLLESTEYGLNNERINELKMEVNSEIIELKDFCKSCKPLKKKK